MLGVLYEQHAFHGHDGLTKWYEQLVAAWDAFEASVEHAEECDDHVLGLLRLVARRGQESLDAEVGVECAFDGERLSSFVGHDAADVRQRLDLPLPDGRMY